MGTLGVHYFQLEMKTIMVVWSVLLLLTIHGVEAFVEKPPESVFDYAPIIVIGVMLCILYYLAWPRRVPSDSWEHQT
jgi:hypothetical protein